MKTLLQTIAETKKCRTLSNCHINIRSLSRSQLIAIQTSLKDLYVITISETHLHQGVTNDTFKIKGFHYIIQKDTADGKGVGVAAYVSDNIAYKGLFNFEVAAVEATWLTIQTIEGKILVCCCYRPPNPADFWDEFEGMIDHVKQANVASYMYILGDLNADLKTWNVNKLIQL